MFHLSYVSTAASLLSQAELADILATCRRNNEALDVSGALLYAGGSFMQVLEGEEATVRALYARIRRDPRHYGVILLDQGNEDAREFDQWSMAFRDFTGNMSAVPGFEELMNRLPAKEKAEGRSTRLRQLVGSARRQLRDAL